jgi:hypothetical protein
MTTTARGGKTILLRLLMPFIMLQLLLINGLIPVSVSGDNLWRIQKFPLT